MLQENSDSPHLIVMKSCAPYETTFIGEIGIRINGNSFNSVGFLQSILETSFLKGEVLVAFVACDYLLGRSKLQQTRKILSLHFDAPNDCKN